MSAKGGDVEAKVAGGGRTRAVEGVYEKNPGSDVWYVRYRIRGCLVRKRIGRKGAAIIYHRKVKALMEQGEGFVPLTATQHAKTDTEIHKARTGVVLMSELCDDMLLAIQSQPEKYKDQINPPRRIAIIRKVFGDRPASTLRPSEIKQWLNSLAMAKSKRTGKPLKPATLNRMKSVISAVFQEGKENDKVSANPARDVRQRPVNNGVIRYLTPDEEDRLRATLLGHLETKSHLAQYQEPIVRHRIAELDVALGTGMRKSEQYGLKWKDVDMEACVITLRDTKNGHARLVYMIDDVVAAMRTLRA